MKFGNFDDKNMEYVIKTPKTPQPWINYLGNDGFFSLISNTLGGYSFYKDAKLRRLTRYRYNNVPTDFGGRYYYIKENDKIWNIAWQPVKTTLDSYECRHGLGYSKFTSSLNNLEAELTAFVPLKENCEIHKITFTNTSSQTKKFSVFSLLEWCLYNAVDDANNFQRNFNIAEVEIEGSTLYHKTEYRERRNHFTFFHVNEEIDGFDTDRASFLGAYNGWDNPQVVEKGKCSNSVASGNSPIASHQLNLNLEKGESTTLIFMLGYVENDEEKKFIEKNVINKEGAKSLINKFDSVVKVDKALDEIKIYWKSLLSNFSINSKDDKLNRMGNIWNQYQCMVTFNLSRSASYFESGTGRGMGFRDSCQDLLGFVHLIGERARERIIDIASIQFEDGSCYHQYQPLTKRGNADIGSGFNDDPLWLVACVSSYIKETGDIEILNAPVPFNNVEGSEKPLFEHLKRSIHYIMNNLGPHKLPLIGRADWNDCLNLNCFSTDPSDSFQTCSNFDSKKAESVFIAAMFVKYGEEYIELCKRINEVKEIEEVNKAISSMTEAVIKDGWDGEWFKRAYDAFGDPVGSNICEEGKIFIEPQGFCTMAKIGEDKQLGEKALKSVRKHLVNDYGVELLSPCYTTYQLKLGEISSYPPGYKENGSVFCHNNTWIVLAYATLGDGENAFDIYKRTCPAYNEEISEIHETEPYVYSQTIAGRDAKYYGKAKNSWLTGTAAWSFVALSQGLFGIIPEFEGLKVTPCLPKDLKEFTAIRHFRNVTYNIEAKEATDNKKGLYVDGKVQEGNIIPYSDEKSEVKVELYY
ncbi:MAG: glycosyl transferase [Sphaerochaetaceae bacterium]|nr:glycosyl transferase [Sphaerochaetaceae bacterium]